MNIHISSYKTHTHSKFASRSFLSRVRVSLLIFALVTLGSLRSKYWYLPRCFNPPWPRDWSCTLGFLAKSICAWFLQLRLVFTGAPGKNQYRRLGEQSRLECRILHLKRNWCFLSRALGVVACNHSPSNHQQCLCIRPPTVHTLLPMPPCCLFGLAPCR